MEGLGFCDLAVGVHRGDDDERLSGVQHIRLKKSSHSQPCDRRGEIFRGKGRGAVVTPAELENGATVDGPLSAQAPADGPLTAWAPPIQTPRPARRGRRL